MIPVSSHLPFSSFLIYTRFPALKSPFCRCVRIQPFSSSVNLCPSNATSSFSLHTVSWSIVHESFVLLASLQWVHALLMRLNLLLSRQYCESKDLGISQLPCCRSSLSHGVHSSFASRQRRLIPVMRFGGILVNPPEGVSVLNPLSHGSSSPNCVAHILLSSLINSANLCKSAYSPVS